MLKFVHLENEFVCYDKNIIIAWLDYTESDNNININSIYVSPKHRNKKIATKLLNLCLNFFKEKSFTLEVIPFRDAPMRIKDLKKFYFKFNFVEDIYNINLLKISYEKK